MKRRSRRALGQFIAQGMLPALAHCPRRVRDLAVTPLAVGMRRTRLSGASQETAIQRSLNCDRSRARTLDRNLQANYVRAVIDRQRWLARPERADMALIWEGQEYLAGAHALGRGVVLASAHTVALWAAGWRAWVDLGRRGFSMSALVRTGGLGPASADCRVTDPRSVDATRGVLRDLHENRLVLVAADNYLASARRTLDRVFLGAWCSFPVGAAALARLAQAPLLPVVALQYGNSYVIRCYPMLTPPSRGDRAADLVLTDALVDLFEKLVHAHPDQYELYPPASSRAHDAPSAVIRAKPDPALR